MTMLMMVMLAKRGMRKSYRGDFKISAIGQEPDPGAFFALLARKLRFIQNKTRAFQDCTCKRPFIHVGAELCQLLFARASIAEEFN